jgi:hypothetical protein
MDDLGVGYLRQEPILVDFPVRQGVRQVALTPADIAKRSTDALDSAMTTIRAMAEKVCIAIAEIPQKPDGVEIEFGLVFDAEVGALIAKTGVETALTVRLSWSPATP